MLRGQGMDDNLIPTCCIHIIKYVVLRIKVEIGQLIIVRLSVASPLEMYG